MATGVIVPTSGYFSDDDGKTYFQDDASKIAPFDHNGKQAVSAYLFRPLLFHPLIQPHLQR